MSTANEYDRLVKWIGAGAVICISIVLSTIWRGYVLSVMWSWFIVTTFGARPIGIAAAAGISIIVTFLTASHRITQDEERSFAMRMIEGILSAILWPALCLAFGAVVKTWL